jgi:iron complex outermembrane receptor protein
MEDRSMRGSVLLSVVSFALLAGPSVRAADVRSTAQGTDVLEEVVVTSTLRRQSLVETPASVTVLDSQTLRDSGIQHFEDVLTEVPNLNWAGGTSRPRYFQLRGIGEREQYEGAPNPSVGFLIDDIDFSGIGMAATLFDVDRVEVLRGPQGMRYGANALAGLIVMRGADPSDQFGVSTEASFADYGTGSVGAVATGGAEALDSSWRVGIQRYRSDGFRRDTYLHRDDTNDRDELTGRAKWRWQPSESTKVDLTWLHADLDNGYDGWSNDNTRRSLADRPGKDSMKADGASMRLETSALAPGDLTVIASGANADSRNSFDGDWGNAQSWAPYVYDYFYDSTRERRTRSLEVRLASHADTATAGSGADSLGWLVGAYAMNLDESLRELSTGEYAEPTGYSSSTNDSLFSKYSASNLALFTQIDGRFAERWHWSAGARGEQRDADYRDEGVQGDEPRLTAESERDRMWGAQATLSYDLNEHRNVFSSLSRGYKAGGFNLGQGALVTPSFGRESLTSLEAGIKSQSTDSRFYWDITAFQMWREHPQVKTGDQLQADDPNSYVFFTVNAQRGTSRGLEASARWQAFRSLQLGGTLALLHTSVEGFNYGGAPIPPRESPHAPEYQVSLNATWRHAAGWMARVDANAMDDYYFDVPPNDQKAPGYQLVHFKAGFETQNWSAYLWVRNVFDEDYVIRGFYFGNEPPAFENTRYTQLGEPRQIGLSMTWSLQ